jgi:bifunctional non-homologous end joining protein LigD
MGLEDYRKKRDFAETPEPGPEVKSSAGGDLFVIQKHAATRLHYDVRLEMDGVLKSWAVPKGPSLDPKEKHLAVHVEDHPLDYAGFEGIIPKGEYGGGTVMVWDVGTWRPDRESKDDPHKAYREGKLKVWLEGKKLRGGFMLLRLKPRPGEDPDKENWLLFKERDEEAREGEEAAITKRAPDSALTGRSLEQIAADADRVWHSEGDEKGELRVDPASIEGARAAAEPALPEPQLANLVTGAPAGDDWIHEIKLDGYRVLCRLDQGRATLVTRRGADWTSHFPTLLEPLARVPARQAVLDGEVVYVEPDGHTSFLKLASALQGGTDPTGSVVYYVFDLLHLDGYDLARTPLLERKQALRHLLQGFTPGDRVRYVDHIQGHGEEFFAQSCELALEGSIAKRARAPYRPGRNRDWLKVKCMERQEFVIGGFTERADAAGGIGALLMGFHEEPGGPLRYAGRVGTGWDDSTMRELRKRLDGLLREEPPFADPPRGREARGVVWVEPRLVAEVEYLSWNRAGMFRHPSFEGLRLDKPAGEVVAEPADDPPSKRAKPAKKPAGAPRGRRPAGGSAGGGEAEVAGVRLTNPDRVLYPEMGLTKLELARYYEDVGEWVLPHIARRPLTLVRCPEGHDKQCFFQKHAVDQFPDSVLRVPIPEDDGSVATYVAVDSLPGLVSLVQMGVLEFHVWGSHMETLEQPDQLVFDFDPDPELPFSRVVEGAELMRDLLAGLGLTSFVKTTGGKGLHVVVPVAPTTPWDQAKAFAKGLAEALQQAQPARYVVNMSKKKRAGKIYVDFLRNGRGATYIAAFSTRRRAGAPVATPLRWDELNGRLRADRYTVANLRGRLAGLRDDPWQGYADVRQELTPAMLASAGVAPSR